MSIRLSAVVAIAIFLTGCAQSERTSEAAKAPRTGSRFSAAGKVNLHDGQPCASQVMFDFRITGSRVPISLAAPVRESRLLTEAANRHRRVRIWGNWRESQDHSCTYVNVTKVEPLSVAVVF